MLALDVTQLRAHCGVDELGGVRELELSGVDTSEVPVEELGALLPALARLRLRAACTIGSFRDFGTRLRLAAIQSRGNFDITRRPISRRSEEFKLEFVLCLLLRNPFGIHAKFANSSKTAQDRRPVDVSVHALPAPTCLGSPRKLFRGLAV